MDNSIEGKGFELDWYMNKTFKSRTVKVLSSVHGGCRKMRFMDDILRGQQMPHYAQPTWTKSAVYAGRGSSSLSYATKSEECDAKTDLTEDNEDEGIGTMTLKEIRRYLRKSAQKSSGKQSIAVSSSIHSDVPAQDKMLILDCSLQFSGLELHLDDSTSNSAESSDDLSPSGIATSLHKPIESVVLESEVMVQETKCPGLALKNRKSAVDSLVSESDISIDDDDCTLGMWQIYKRRSHEGKKSRRCGSQSDPSLDEQTSSESSMTPAATFSYCFINRVPDIDEHLLADSPCPSDVVPSLGNYEQGSSALSCNFDLFEKMRDNSLKPQSDFTTYADAIEGSSCKGDMLCSEVLVSESAMTSREDVNSGEGVHQNDFLKCESSHACQSGGSPQTDRQGRNSLLTEAAPWQLKPRSKSSSNEVSLSVQQLESAGGQELTFSCERTENLDNGPSPAAVAESGQSLLLEEKCSYKAAKSTSAVTVMMPLIQPTGVTNKSVNNEVAELSQKKSSETPVVDLLEYSSPQSAKLKTEFESSHNVSMASQQSPDENISGSPVSLFSTERLDTEEEQALEQVKPSKIPCKRKAISPLSRERLLQASKYGDCERNFQDLDKRGLKKLPRAFKGFIGRERFSRECVAAFPRAKNSITLESSPPEKPNVKEEVLPGSPCHNREKFVPSKYLVPKVSSLSSSYGSSGAAANDAPTILHRSSTSPSYVQRLSLVLNSSPSPPRQSLNLDNSKSSPVNSSPPVPAKGILRSSSPTCQGACKCEECMSLRCRAEKAAEFSQRQMHDIEGLAVKLLKELNTMRSVVEENLIRKNAPRVDSPCSALSLEQVKKAASNAFETEKMAKLWLVRMARDCNRYCKIMRMQERKLTFADESGGQLCHVKLFHTQTQPQPDAILPTIVAEKPAMASSADKESSCLSDEPAIDVASA